MQRHARQTQLAEVGSAGQARLASARVRLRLEGLAGDVAARYLAGAGVGELAVVSQCVGDAARSVDPATRVDVVDDDDGNVAVAAGFVPAGGFDLRHSAAREIARGAQAALDVLRAVWLGGAPSGPVALGPAIDGSTPSAVVLLGPARREAACDNGKRAMRDVKQHPWIEGNLVVGRRVLDQVDEEARRAYGRDEESCGFLVGPSKEGGRLDGIVPMVNRANALHRLDPEAYPRTGRMYFDIDSMKFENAIKRGDAEGRPVKVLYHSHLDAGAYFSPTDAEVAKMGQGEPPWDLAYLVTSVRSGQVDDRKLFVWEPSSRVFVESPLEVDEGV